MFLQFCEFQIFGFKMLVQDITQIETIQKCVRWNMTNIKSNPEALDVSMHYVHVQQQLSSCDIGVLEWREDRSISVPNVSLKAPQKCIAKTFCQIVHNRL